MTNQADILELLRVLVASDTRNPPRNISLEDPVFDFIIGQLDGFKIDAQDHGAGSISLLAVRGEPSTVFNFHLDTVPDTDGWSSDPFKLAVANDRATGLGACDIKGALACMLAVTRQTRGDVAILVTTDEEAGVGQAVTAFLAQGHGFANAIVAEPTLCKAVAAHRGIVTARAVFRGVAGHASSQRVLTDSANHRAVRWAARCLAKAEAWNALEQGGLQGVPFNIGRIDGGIKPNMIAERCELRLGLRTLPGQCGETLITELFAEAPGEHLLEWEITFDAPSLPSDVHAGAEGATALAAQLGLEQGPAVGFWSEAALFSAAGLDALVLGSGDIAQAHTAEEWVALSQLERLAKIYTGLVTRGNE